MKRIKYRKFFEKVSCSENVQDYIIDLIENKSIIRLNHFYDYFLVDGLKDLCFPISVHLYRDNRICIVDSSFPVKISEVIFYENPSTGGSLGCLYTENGFNIEREYSLSTKKLLATRKESNKLKVSTDCYNSYTSISIEHTLKHVNNKICAFIALEDIILEEDDECDFIKDINNLLSKGFSITDLSFVSIIEFYSNLFKVEINYNGINLLKLCKRNGQLFLVANFEYGNKSHCTFRSSAHNLSSLQEEFDSFLNHFGVL